jgi:hypothetical protein
MHALALLCLFNEERASPLPLRLELRLVLGDVGLTGDIPPPPAANDDVTECKLKSSALRVAVTVDSPNSKILGSTYSFKYTHTIVINIISRLNSGPIPI